uniref:ANK_REP_REGION domain-containing protein n=1 Tax=Setaria digitata TaxID=48799 RepID=A0A915PDL4_9BILA
MSRSRILYSTMGHKAIIELKFMTDGKECLISVKDDSLKKPKPCCACPETKKARDECVILFGEEHCGELIEAHKKCMRQYGYELQVCQQDILKADIAIKNHIEEIRQQTFMSQKELTLCTRNIKDEMAELAHLIDALEKFGNKMSFRNDRVELLAQVKEHRCELEKNHQMLRQAILEFSKIMEMQSRKYLLQDGKDSQDIELRSRQKRAENLKAQTLKATESLTSLVTKMSDQLKLSEDTTSTLIHSSSLLRDTECEYSSLGAHIQSGGKLISKYGRRECTDKVLITFALLLYVVVILKLMDEKPAKTLEMARAELIDSLRQNRADDAKRLLQKYGTLRYAKDDSGRTAIHWAASGGCLEIVQFCISQQEDDAITPDDMGWTPLMIACSAGRLEVVKYLINLPLVNVNTPNNNKQTALHYAASKNRPQITTILLKNGANVNAQDNYRATPLHRAASQGHEKIVPILLSEPSLRINLTDSAGCTPLHLAVEEQREDIAILLAENGADLYFENKEKQTPLALVKTNDLLIKLKAAADRYSSKIH